MEDATQNRPGGTGRRPSRAASAKPLVPQPADALVAASERAERLIVRLEEAVAHAESRLAEATRLAERSIAVASELQEDASSLIVALQGLATQVNAQVRDHTVALMATFSDAERNAEEGDPKRASAELSEEVDSLIDELRATAQDISGDLEAKGGEIRRLLDEARRDRLESDSRHQASTPATGRPGPTVRLRDEALPALRERAEAVRDEVVIDRGAAFRGSGRYTQAAELATQGLSADEIARRCGLGREEVRMLLKLHGAGERG